MFREAKAQGGERGNVCFTDFPLVCPRFVALTFVFIIIIIIIGDRCELSSLNIALPEDFFPIFSEAVLI